MPDSPESELTAEQAYLEQARAQLAAMRERTLSLQVAGGDPIAAERLAATLWLRARSLEDDPRSALFFGRLDGAFDSGLAARDAEGMERLYIGRRHVSDESGDPVVIDWRAPISTAYYQASPTDPRGVRLRRRFGFDHGAITAFEDEWLTDPVAAQSRSHILAAEIERPRVGPMRDIVSTIQPEQDELVRLDETTTVCIQGAPGTGKTAVGLHRAAWLLYAFRDKLARAGVLVIGPNRAFLDHVGAVLPMLGEVDVRHTTIEELTASVPVRAVDTADVATLKGDARLAQVLHRAVWSAIGEVEEALVVPRGARKWRVPAYEVREIVDELRGRGVRYDAARNLLPQRLAHAVLVKMEAAGDSPDDRVQDAVARSAAVKSFAAQAWPVVDARRLLHRLFSDADALATAADGVLSEQEQRMLLWDKPARTAGSARWSVADTVLLDELEDVLRRTGSLGHVVLDEAQDLSAMQLRAVGRRCATGAATVLGDIAQGTTPWAARSWAETLSHLGKADGTVSELRRGFRVPAAVIDFASRLLPVIAPGLAAPEPVRENPGRLVVQRVESGDREAAIVTTVADLIRDPGSVAVIAADASVDAISAALTAAGLEHGVLGAGHGDVDHQVDVVPASVAKGLEFDRVVVVEPSAIQAAEPSATVGLRRLYVVLTRAVTALTVVHSEPLPPALQSTTEGVPALAQAPQA